MDDGYISYILKILITLEVAWLTWIIRSKVSGMVWHLVGDEVDGLNVEIRDLYSSNSVVIK